MYNMLSRNVIARDITNLTDARYFAARGINYLLMDLDQIPLDQIIEIKEWIEGPEILLIFSEDSIRFVDESIIKLSPAGISAKSSDTQASLEHLSAYTTIFQYAQNEILLNDQLFVGVQHISDLDGLSEQTGVILSGGEEDVVGVKSFEDLDDLLDALEE